MRENNLTVVHKSGYWVFKLTWENDSDPVKGQVATLDDVQKIIKKYRGYDSVRIDFVALDTPDKF